MRHQWICRRGLLGDEADTNIRRGSPCHRRALVAPPPNGIAPHKSQMWVLVSYAFPRWHKKAQWKRNDEYVVQKHAAEHAHGKEDLRGALMQVEGVGTRARPEWPTHPATREPERDHTSKLGKNVGMYMIGQTQKVNALLEHGTGHNGHKVRRVR